DLLVLAGLDPADLPLAVKNAIADWVSGGGRLAVTLAPTPRLGDGRFDALLREPGRYGLGRVTVGETDWAALVGERAAAEVEAVEPLEPKPALPWLIAIALGVIGLVDFVLLRLVKHQPAGAVSVGLITVCLILVGFFSMVHVARPFEKKALVTQADDSIVRLDSSQRAEKPGHVGWFTARAADGDAEVVQLFDGNRLRRGPAAVDELSLGPGEPVLLLVGDRLAAVGDVSVEIDVIHHRGVRRAGGFTLAGGKVVDLSTLGDLGAVEGAGTLVVGAVDGEQLRAVWE
ncbi:MAG: hypothetical protein AAF656_09885, partial [Planctomycetota bacterium]